MGRILYIRHGQASLFSDNYDQLSPLGKKQAVAVGQFLAKENITIDALYSGPLHRHHQTIEGILEGMKSSIPYEELEGLREHQGYTILKKLLPELAQQDEQIKELVNRPWESKSDQIKHHIRIYEHFSLRWANGEFDHMINGSFQPWKIFEENASDAYANICKESASGKTTLVVTSGGPKAVACGRALDLSLEKIMHASWVIYNCSISEFLTGDNRYTLSSFNNISFLEDKSSRTLV